MGMSIWHLLIILVILLLVFGPQRLEGIGTSLGKAIRGFKKGIDENIDNKATTTVTIEKIEEKEPPKGGDSSGPKA